ncbi:MAG: hypothetical protein ACXWYD_12625 [Candidatus Binatia bacterium]
MKDYNKAWPRFRGTNDKDKVIPEWSASGFYGLQAEGLSMILGMGGRR